MLLFQPSARGAYRYEGDYVSAIEGVRFFGKHELMPVSNVWSFQVTPAFSAKSAQLVLNDLPEDCQLSFFDPEAGAEEAWIFVRRVDHRFFLTRVRHGASGPWPEEPVAVVLRAFVSSPLVHSPSGAFSSFEVSFIPEHQRSEHIKPIA
jgi:hypothetical protein